MTTQSMKTVDKSTFGVFFYFGEHTKLSEMKTWGNQVPILLFLQ